MGISKACRKKTTNRPVRIRFELLLTFATKRNGMSSSWPGAQGVTIDGKQRELVAETFRQSAV